MALTVLFQLKGDSPTTFRFATEDEKVHKKMSTVEWFRFEEYDDILGWLYTAHYDSLRDAEEDLAFLTNLKVESDDKGIFKFTMSDDREITDKKSKDKMGIKDDV